MWSSFASLVLRFRTSLLFTPLMFAVGGLVLSFVTVYVDQQGYGRKVTEWLPGSPNIDEVGARAVFSTIASGMFSATSIVISLTFVALTMMSAQMGPRLLAFFMGDRRTKVCLGIFVATIVYALVSMASVGAEGEATFAPHISFVTAIVLAFLSLGTMIYFVDHIAQSIQTDAIVARLANECGKAITIAVKEAPTNAHSPTAEEIADFEACFDETCQTWRAGADGYLTSINRTAILDAASRHNAILNLRFRQNSFIFTGQVIVQFRCPPGAENAVREDLAAAITFAEKRTPAQQIDFEMSALSEVALRALSPGINDPYTAAACIGYLGNALTRIERERQGDIMLCDDEGVARILRVPGDVPHYLDTCIAPIIEAGAGAPIAMAQMIQALNWLTTVCDDTRSLKAIARQRAALEHLIASKIQHPTERDRLLSLFTVNSESLA